MNFAKFLEMKFLEWQQSQGGRKTVKEFAAYIGVSRPAISTWWNGDRTPEGESIRKIADKLGAEVYDVLGMPRPDEYLFKVQQLWHNLDPEAKKAILEQVVNINKKNVQRKKNEQKRP